MRLIFIFLLLSHFYTSDINGQNVFHFWEKTQDKKSELKVDREGGAIVFIANNENIQYALDAAPDEASFILNRKGSLITLPQDNGILDTFTVWKSEVAEPGLLESYPNIHSYKGYNINNPSQVMRMTQTTHGLYSSIRTESHITYIEPDQSCQGRYKVFNASDVDDISKFICGSDFDEHLESSKMGKRSSGENMLMRKYRMGLACTGVWGQKRGTKEKVIEEMVIFMDKANLVFESELAVRMVLIEKNDKLIFLDPNNDPYNDVDVGGSLVGQNTNALNNIVGVGSYDIGHIFSVCFDVGGIAGGTVCTENKGAGVTCFNGNSISNYIVLVFCHEVGHQMSASHTFNHCGNSSQTALNTAYEPGSGNTIMSYSGLCGSDNVGSGSESYYHVASLDQVYTFTNQEGAQGYTCAELVDINNHAPVITKMPPSGYFIPKSTPFVLDASAEDEDGDDLTFNWEQYDAEKSIPLGDTTTLGDIPLFKSGKPSKKTFRLFPTNSNIINGLYFNYGDMLPYNTRNLTFKFIARDNNPMGNAAAWDEMVIHVDGTSKPFKFLTPNGSQTFITGQKVDITWEVGNTAMQPINTKFVDVFISKTTNLDFNPGNILLVAENIPNSGRATIIIPNTVSNTARLIIKARDNIYFTNTLINWKINTPNFPTFFTDVENSVQTSCLPEQVQYTITSVGFNDFDIPIHCEVVGGLPEGAVASFEKSEMIPGENNTLTIDLNQTKGDSTYFITVRTYIAGLDTFERNLTLFTKGTDIDALKAQLPVNGASGMPTLQVYTWEKRKEADKYILEVSKDPTFQSQVIKLETQDTFYKSNIYLEKATIYFWRVKAINSCREGSWSYVSAFQTEAVQCATFSTGDLNVNITFSGTPSIELPLTINASGKVEDVNVAYVKGKHQNIKDLTVDLVSPNGKASTLWSNMCPSNSSINSGFDDESTLFLNCPLSTGKIMKPMTPLAVFKGEEISGTWTLNVKDNKVGDGGSFSGFSLEFCSKISLNPPTIQTLDTIKVMKKSSVFITKEQILATDPNDIASDIVFTLTAVPQYGQLYIENKGLNIGNTFTQEDINSGKLRYTHMAEYLTPDGFSFIVTDQNKGWSGGVSKAEILVYTIVGTKDINPALIKVFPNPFDQYISVVSERTPISECSYRLFNTMGNCILSGQFTSEQISTSNLISGIYILEISQNSSRSMYKLIKK
ncbi:MAG: proprotein convertase P-domain-containing protein [Lewinellaceae bacterium]|nr:proprotein convertase P-domain-containing protein [Lewinellaceae bacterium]